VIYDFGLWAKKFESCWFRRCDRFQSWTAHFGKEEDFCPTKNRTPLFQLVVSHLTDIFFSIDLSSIVYYQDTWFESV